MIQELRNTSCNINLDSKIIILKGKEEEEKKRSATKKKIRSWQNEKEITSAFVDPLFHHSKVEFTPIAESCSGLS